jgi:arabinogalactan oligomer / maltooligosaccharide transport system permease protein
MRPPLALCLVALLATPHAAHAGEDAPDERPEILLWHAYRAAEAEAIELWAQRVNGREKDLRVKLLKVPYDAFLDKITAAIPRGKGPDVFIAAHDTIGDWAEAKTVSPLDDVLDPTLISSLQEGLLPPLLYKGSVYGIPLAFKSLALWRNVELAPAAPATMSELVEGAKRNTGNGGYGLVYENRLLYFHAPLMFGFGGGLFDDVGRPIVDSAANAESIRFAAWLSNDQKLVPQEVSGTLTTALFNDGKAAFIVTGPWSVGEIERDKVRYAVSPLPVLDVKALGFEAPPDAKMRPLMSVEAAMISGRTEKRELAVRVAKMLASEEASVLRLTKGLQPVALKSAWGALEASDLSEADKGALLAFRAQLASSVPTPNTTAMKAMWSPVDMALGQSLGQGADPKDTLAEAQKKLEGIIASAQSTGEAVDPTPFYVLVTLLLLGALFWAVLGVRRFGARALLRDAWKNRIAYVYLAPAMLGMLVLVFVPFSFGVGMGFFKHTWGEYSFVGLENYARILDVKDSRFFYTLGITVLWTASNVFLHVTIGVFLALVLSQARLRFRGLYRVLFILPWAVPNYITALIWKGMFHPEFGAINAALGLEGFSWMNQTWSAFLANLATNTWLGFPFMMVTALGGLTAIPKDLYEAADLDGASPLRQFFTITLPLLKPTLAPAIVLGTVWTFNMFNIIYLVSGGAPGGNTDILITEAFRWAFERGQGGAFGYAAAYSTLIFLMLLGYTMAANRVTRAVQGHKP